MPRLFAAIDFPEPVRLRLSTLCGGIPGARWLPIEQFHLTLRFMGEVDDDSFADISSALAGVEGAPFSLRLSGVGHFPPRGDPKVLWAGVEDDGSLDRLHNGIEAELRRLGLEPDHRRFHPHVTLARLKYPPLIQVRDFLAAHADFASEPLAIETFHLYSSRLGSAGAVHRMEASYPLFF